MKAFSHSFRARLHSRLHGFTLVELIIVITILAILWTISFLSLQGYSVSARDSVRIENLVNLKKWLDMFQVVAGTYPMPEGAVTITASWSHIGYQWFAKDQIVNIAKLSESATRDALDSSMYTTYLVNPSRTKMQIMTFLENIWSVTVLIPPNQEYAYLPMMREMSGIIGLNTTFASSSFDYSKRYPKTLGDTLGILLSSGSLQPIQESGTWVDVVLTNTGYLAVFSKTDSIIGTGAVLFTSIYNRSNELLNNKNMAYLDSSLVGYWDMETLTGALLRDFSGYGNNGICHNGVLSGTCGVVWPQFINGNGTSGMAMSFDGVYNRVDYPTNSLPSGSGARTLLIKTKFGTGYMTPVASIVYWWSNGPYQTFELGVFGDDVLFGRWWWDIPLRKVSTIDSEVVGIRYDGNITWTFFDNGKFQSINLWDPLSTANGLHGWIGWGRHFNYYGTIDEVRIYNRALSDSEIQSIYNATK